MDKPGQIKMVFVGDVLFNKIHPLLSSECKKIFSGSDVISCNFEGVVKNPNSKLPRKIGPRISQAIDSPSYLQELGFNLFNLANNHVMDYGSKSLSTTLEMFPESYYIGAGNSFKDAYKSNIRDINGIKIGFLSFSEWDFGVVDDQQKSGFAWINHRITNELIANTKKKVDFLVVQVHAGLENIDIPLPEWRDKYRELIDCGVDLLIGHHPHVKQGFEKYQNSYIFYSLGNFFMEYDGGLSSNTGLILEIYLSRKLELKYKSYSCYVENGIVYSNAEVIQDLALLFDSNSYIKKINKICEETWDSYYKKYYLETVSSFSLSKSLFSNLRALDSMLKGRRINELFLLHNLAKETHFYVVRRYLKNRLSELNK